MSSIRRLVLACSAVALLFVPAAPAGSNVVPYAGFYDCRAKDGFTYLHDIQLRVNGGYVQGFVDASGRRFKRVIGSGRFSRSGSKLTFHSGPMRPTYAIVKTPQRFGVWKKGERNYSYYCYYTKKN